jgi:hypothetical protein
MSMTCEMRLQLVRRVYRHLTNFAADFRGGGGAKVAAAVARLLLAFSVGVDVAARNAQSLDEMAAAAVSVGHGTHDRHRRRVSSLLVMQLVEVKVMVVVVGVAGVVAPCMLLLLHRSEMVMAATLEEMLLLWVVVVVMVVREVELF